MKSQASESNGQVPGEGDSENLIMAVFVAVDDAPDREDHES